MNRSEDQDDNRFADHCDDGPLLAMLRRETLDATTGQYDANWEHDAGCDPNHDALLEHIETCSYCQTRLEALAANDDDWKMAGDVLSSGDLADADAEADDSDATYRRANRDAFRASRLNQRPVAWTESMAKHLLSPPSHPEMLGRLGRYEVERVVGSGGMGVVFKAFDTELNRPVAIKVLAPYLSGSGPARRRFTREARAAAAIVHEHVVPIHNVETEGDTPYLVMQYVAGESLQGRIDREGPLDVCEILRIATQVASGLAAAHAQGLVHRDIKPSNILLEPSVERALITDFGLARAADDASITHTGFHPGTPQYMSPEQAAGDSVDARSDLFSLGSVLYAMCSGRPPFRAETTLAILRRIADDEARPIQEINPNIPVWLCAIISKLMAKRPEDRYASAEEVSILLEQCLAHAQQPSVHPLPQELQPVVTARGRNARPPILKFLAAAAGGFLALLFGVLIVLEWNKGTITIECEADDVPIRITQGDRIVEQLTVSRSGKTVRLAAGAYEVEIENAGDNMSIANGTVTLKRGHTEVVQIVNRGLAEQNGKIAASGEPESSRNNTTTIDPDFPADGKPVDKQKLVQELTERDRKFSRHSIEIQRVWNDLISPHGMAQQERHNSIRLGGEDPGMPQGLPDAYEQPHRIQYIWTGQNFESTLEVLADLETAIHPDHGPLAARTIESDCFNYRRIWNRDQEMFSHSSEITPLCKGEKAWEYLLPSGIGFTPSILSVSNAVEVDQGYVLKGLIGLPSATIGNRKNCFELLLDKELILRKGVIQYHVYDFVVATSGRKQFGDLPAVAERAAVSVHYVGLDEKRSGDRGNFQYEVIAVSKMLTKQEYDLRVNFAIPKGTKLATGLNVVEVNLEGLPGVTQIERGQTAPRPEMTPSTSAASDAPSATPDYQSPPKLINQLQGRWVVTRIVDPQGADYKPQKETGWFIEGSSMTSFGEGFDIKMPFRVDEQHKPAHFDLLLGSEGNSDLLGLIEVTGNKIRWAHSGNTFPEKPVRPGTLEPALGVNYAELERMDDEQTQSLGVHKQPTSGSQQSPRLIDQLQGRWVATRAVDSKGADFPTKPRRGWVIEGNSMTAFGDGAESTYTFRLDDRHSPAHFDVLAESQGMSDWLGLIEITGNRVKWVHSGNTFPAKPVRPEFPELSAGVNYVEWERVGDSRTQTSPENSPVAEMLERLQGTWDVTQFDDGFDNDNAQENDRTRRAVIRGEIMLFQTLEQEKVVLVDPFKLVWPEPDQPDVVDFVLDPNNHSQSAPGRITCDGHTFRLAMRNDEVEGKIERPSEICPGEAIFYIECTKQAENVDASDLAPDRTSEPFDEPSEARTLDEITAVYNEKTRPLRQELFDPPIPNLTVEQMHAAMLHAAEVYRKNGDIEVASVFQKCAESKRLPDGVSFSGVTGTKSDGFRQITPGFLIPNGAGFDLRILDKAELRWSRDGWSSRTWGDIVPPYSGTWELISVDVQRGTGATENQEPAKLTPDELTEWRAQHANWTKLEITDHSLRMLAGETKTFDLTIERGVAVDSFELREAGKTALKGQITGNGFVDNSELHIVLPEEQPSGAEYSRTTALHYKRVATDTGIVSHRHWQQAEPYAGPDHATFFPDNPDGGLALDALWNSGDKDSRSDAEILQIVRNGLRRTQSHRMPILRWIGNKYIWGVTPQNPDAIELMYHAADFGGDNADPMGTRHAAVYFGLSVVQPKSPAILRTLAELAVRVDDPNDLERIAWGAKNQQAELLEFLKPFQVSDDPAIREKAEIRRRIFAGELQAFAWAREIAHEKAKAKFDSQLPLIRETLMSGSTGDRTELLRTILHERVALIMDDSFVVAFAQCAQDTDPHVRNNVAIIAGHRWVWETDKQNPDAIQLMLKLSHDEDRNVRYNAVYYGLSTVRDKSDDVIRRLLEIAMADREWNMFGRIEWGLLSDGPAVTKILDEFIAGDDSAKSKAAQEVCQKLRGQAPDHSDTPPSDTPETPPTNNPAEAVPDNVPNDVNQSHLNQTRAADALATVSRLFDAARRNDTETIKSIARWMSERHMQDMVKNVQAAEIPDPDDAWVDGVSAIAVISRFPNIPRGEPGDRNTVSVLFTLSLTDERWSITEFGAKSLESLSEEIEQFKQAHPSAIKFTAAELPRADKSESPIPPADGQPVLPKLADDGYVKSGVPLADQTWPMPPWGEERNGLSAGLRVIGSAHVGGTVEAELWIRNSSDKNITFSQCRRVDVGLSIVATDNDGKERHAEVIPFDAIPLFNSLLLPPGHITKVKDFTIKLGARSEDKAERHWASLPLPPGDYKLHATWSNSHPLVTHAGDWTGVLTTGEVDFKIEAPLPESGAKQSLEEIQKIFQSYPKATDRTRKAFELAATAARKDDKPLNSLHLLGALLRDRSPTLLHHVAKQQKIPLKELIQRCDDAARSPDRSFREADEEGSAIQQTTSVQAWKELMATAEMAAKKWKHDYLGTEHLSMALVANGTLTKQFLSQQGVEADAVRDMALRVLFSQHRDAPLAALEKTLSESEDSKQAAAAANDIPADLPAAAALIREQARVLFSQEPNEQVQFAVKMFEESSENDVANRLALELATDPLVEPQDAPNPVRFFGLGILSNREKASTLEFLRAAKDTVPENERQRIAEIIGAVERGSLRRPQSSRHTPNAAASPERIPADRKLVATLGDDSIYLDQLESSSAAVGEDLKVLLSEPPHLRWPAVQ